MGDQYAKIRARIREIPSGSVATYGQIAALAGLPRRARLVGYVLRTAPDGEQLPWHRVLNARGASSFPPHSDAWLRQRQLLESEGVVFVDGRVCLQRFRWVVTLDELLWKW